MSETPFPIAGSRFDQKNEMFKRSVWDPAVKPLGDKFYREVGYRDRPGYRKVDYALRNASWELEWGFAQGNAHAGFGLYGSNKPPGAVHTLTRAVVARTAVFDRLLVRADDLLGYGRPLSPDEFWQA